MDEIDDYPSHKPYRTLHNVKLWLACIGAALILLYFLFPCNCGDRQSARSASCLSNLKQQALAVNEYSQDYDGVLPQGSVWIDRTRPYLKVEGAFQCPELTVDHNGPTKEVYGYGYYSPLSGVNSASII